MNYLIKATGEITEISPGNGKTFTLQELHGYVDGYIEVLSAQRLQSIGRLSVESNSLMVVNEEGKLKGFPVNEIATAMYFLGDIDPIVGDVVLTDRCTMGEDD